MLCYAIDWLLSSQHFGKLGEIGSEHGRGVKKAGKDAAVMCEVQLIDILSSSLHFVF